MIRFEDQRSPLTPSRGARTPLLDRERELDLLRVLLARPEVALVTIVGPGGVGKTRVAMEIVEAPGDGFRDGARLIELAPLRDHRHVATAIAQELGLVELPDQPIENDLLSHLRRANLLLVLDNFEHVIEAVPLVSSVLHLCPSVKVLATSRKPLGLTGERLVPVSPLPIPQDDPDQHLDSLAQVPSVRLLLDCAQAVRPDIALTQENASAICGICRRLDGLPLAIELAATRFGLLTPSSLLARLDQALPVLRATVRDGSARHASLEATIGWSYELLTPELRALFRQLAVFAGGFTIEAAQAVIGVDRVSLDALGALVDESLVVRRDGYEDEPRLGMIETVREYAFERLQEEDDAGAIREAHAAYFAELAARGDRELSGPHQATWAVRLDDERGNLRGALAWALETAHDNGDLALRIAGDLWRFWDRLGYVREGREWLERALASDSGHHSSARAKALFSLGNVLYQDTWRARQLYEDSLRIYRSLSDHLGTARALRGLALLAANSGDVAAARRAYLESLQMARREDDQSGVAMSLHHLGVLAVRHGDLEDGWQRQEEARRTWEAIGNRVNEAYALRWLGRVRNLQGKPGDALRLLVWAQEIFDAVRDEDGAAYVLVERSLAELSKGDLDEAAERLGSALKAFVELDNTDGIVVTIEAAAEYALRSDRSLAAAELWGAASAWRDDAGVPLTPYEAGLVDRSQALARSRTGNERFAAAWEAGRAGSVRDAIRDAQGLIGASLLPALTGPSDREPDPRPAVGDEGGAWARSLGVTPREAQLLPLLIAGQTDQQIAASLFISRRTVTTHISSILRKLDVPSRAAIAAMAARHGF